MIFDRERPSWPSFRADGGLQRSACRLWSLIQAASPLNAPRSTGWGGFLLSGSLSTPGHCRRTARYHGVFFPRREIAYAPRRRVPPADSDGISSNAIRSFDPAPQEITIDFAWSSHGRFAEPGDHIEYVSRCVGPGAIRNTGALALSSQGTRGADPRVSLVCSRSPAPLL